MLMALSPKTFYLMKYDQYSGYKTAYHLTFINKFSRCSWHFRVQTFTDSILLVVAAHIQRPHFRSVPALETNLKAFRM